MRFFGQWFSNVVAVIAAEVFVASVIVIYVSRTCASKPCFFEVPSTLQLALAHWRYQARCRDERTSWHRSRTKQRLNLEMFPHGEGSDVRLFLKCFQHWWIHTCPNTSNTNCSTFGFLKTLKNLSCKFNFFTKGLWTSECLSWTDGLHGW